MSLLLALFLVVHGGIHIGYLCSRAWPFAPGDPWLVTSLGAPPDTVGTVAAALALVAFLAFLFAALVAVGILPRVLWAPLVVLGAAASLPVLIVYVTLGTIPGAVIDAALLWDVFVIGRAPSPFFGRHHHESHSGHVAGAH